MSSQSEEFLETLERTHVVLFHDGNEDKKKTEYGFIKKGLDKGKDWEKDIIPWLKKEDPKLTIKKINQIKSQLNGQTKARVAQKS